MKDLTLEEAGEVIKEKLQNRYILALGTIVAFAAFLRFRNAFFPGLWLDEANMARMAVDISQHPLQYSTEWRGSLTKRPPVFIYLMAISNTIFGGVLGTETAIRLVNPIMGVVGVIGSYFLGREMYNRKIGLIAAALLAVNPLSWFLSTRVLLETSLATIFIVTIGALYYSLEDRKYSRYAFWALGPLVALSILTKQPAYTLGLIIPTYFIYKKKDDLADYFMTDKDFSESKLHTVLTDRNYYIAGGLGLVTLLPWMIRNIAVCSFPLCGISNALEFASKDVTRTTASVQSPYYFILAMGMILTLPVLIFLGARILQYFKKSLNTSPDTLVKKSAVFVVINTAAFFIDPRFSPMALLTSISIFASEDSDKLLWLWVGFGLGFMSVPEIKVARYAVFTIPALILISSKGIYSLSEWISGNLPFEKVDITTWHIILLITAPLLIFSFIQGQATVSNGGSAALSPAGEWLGENMQSGENFASTSPQMKFFARPHVEVASANRLPQNSTAFQEFAVEEDISYMVVDIYERTQPDWLQLEVAPYRLPQSLRSDLRQGRTSPQAAIERFQNAPDYMIPLKSFGETRVPLTQSNTQPEVVIYRINRTAIQ